MAKDVAKWMLIAALGSVFASAARAQPAPSPQEKQALAPTGKLRAALYLGGPTNVIVDPVSGEMKGVGYAIGKELAKRMGVPYEPVIYKTPKLLVDDVSSGKWDVAFVAQDSEREKIMNFSGVYLSLEHGYLVPGGSPIKVLNDVDRPGIRVGVPAGGSVIIPLKRTLKNAEIIGVGMPEAAELVKSGKVDVFAANKANLFAISDTLPGSRVLDGRFSVDRFALGMPKEREAAMPYVRKFIEDVKADGLVKAAAKKAGVRGAVEE
ncbi:MAG: transporter substrate-binding domain-containing protein [Proteobacteria bacterium]|nr:transporter substrate-binding domain-containing protein [Pseudomonadota bacterium]